MGHLIRPVARVRPVNYPIGIRRYGLTEGLCFLGIPVGNGMWDCVSRRWGTELSTPLQRSSAEGMEVLSNEDGDGFTFLEVDGGLAATPNFSWASITTSDDNGSTSTRRLFNYGPDAPGGAGLSGCLVGRGNTTVYAGRIITGSESAASTTLNSSANYYTAAAIRNSGSVEGVSAIFYKGGVSFSTGTLTVVKGVNTNKILTVMTRQATTANRGWVGGMSMLAIWARTVQPDEHAEWYVNPYALLAPERRIQYFIASAPAAGKPWLYYAQQRKAA